MNRRIRILCALMAAGWMIGAPRVVLAQCPAGEEKVGEDAKFWYCEPREYIDLYTRFSATYGFVGAGEYAKKTVWHDLNKPAARNLEYFKKSVAARAKLSREEAIMVAWWAYIEGILDKNAPWGYVNCASPALDGNDSKGLECQSFRSGGWQAGYGVQVYDQLTPDGQGRTPLQKAFDRLHPNSNPNEVGNKVLTAAGIKLKFPPTLDWQTLTSRTRVDNVAGSGRSNHFWASILMRDPVISAALESAVLKLPRSRCYLPQHATSCDWYYQRREQHSTALWSIIHAWSELEKPK